jgi:uncharacterized membrane protein
VIAAILRGGLVVSALLLGAALVAELVSGERRTPAVKMFHLGSAPTVADLLGAIGLLVLALTPVVRVLSLVYLWTRERDWRYVLVSVTVVIVLGAAIALGGG